MTWQWPLSRMMCILVMLCSLCSAGAQPSDPPNLIFILTDDQGVDSVEGIDGLPNDLACHTPNLATWASQGVAFRNTRVNPNCSPTRASTMSGRYALHTGVTGVLRTRELFRTLVSLQGHEWTIAEMLKEKGYYTIFADKWHIGEAPELEQTPLQQGFDEQIGRSLREIDDPNVLGDEYITWLVNKCAIAVINRPDRNKPYALFLWSNDPHARDEVDGFLWWKVHPRLLLSGEDYYTEDTNRNRYRAVVESIDTEFGRLLRSIGVVDDNQQYIPSSNTVVIFMSDNGTDSRVARLPDKSKKTLYELGVRAPLVVFGEKVPSGALSDTPISQVDLFDTIGDIIDASTMERGSRPRDSMSFADLIGWSDDPLPRREYTLSSLGFPDPEQQHVALSDGRWKLICKAGGEGLHLRSGDEFYDLVNDPDETDNLVLSGLEGEAKMAYLTMRDEIVNYWPTAVAVRSSTQFDVGATEVMTLNSENEWTGEVGHLNPNMIDAVESRLFVRFDDRAIKRAVPKGTRAEDVVGVQLILAYNDDVDVSGESDTGTLQAFPMLIDWYSGYVEWRIVEDLYNPAKPCGSFDPAPNIVTIPPDTRLSGLPMPSGTPVSLGQNDNLLSMVKSWVQEPSKNHGLVIMAKPDYALDGDQRLRFFEAAMLRITLRQ